MPVSTVISTFRITIDGLDIPNDWDESLTEVLVENSLHLPDVATIRFNAYDTVKMEMIIADDPKLEAGKEIEIYGGNTETNDEDLIFKGEITAVELQYGEDLSLVAVIEAQDKSHRLHRGRKSETYLQQSISDIASSVIGGASLGKQVDSTSGVYEYVMQGNKTDWEFLWQLASRVGYHVHFDFKDGKLHFVKPWQDSGVITLKWGESLRQFRIRSTTGHQVAPVKVKGWDWKKKEAIVGEAKEGTGKGDPKTGETKTGTSQASAFGKGELTIVDIPVDTQAQADAMAKALAEDISGAHVYAEGMTTQGMGKLLPGKKVELEKIGKRFSGTYYVTSTTHLFNEREGYSTSFVVGGSLPQTLGDILRTGPATNGSNRVQGVVTGIVTNNKDPDDYNRVKVKFPWLDESLESDWSRMAGSGAGKETGMQWLPEVNDEVLVAFEHGDINHPYVIGSLWNGKDKPPESPSDAVGGDGKVNLRTIKSRSGHVIVLDDTNGEEQIIIRDMTGKNEFIITSSDNKLAVNIEGDVSIVSKGKVTVESTQDMSFESKANLNIKATGNCSIEASGNLSMEAKANLTAKGIQATFEGTAKSEVKAATVSINGSAMTEIKGGLVKIN